MTGVPERKDVPIRMDEPLEKASFRAESDV